MCKCNQTDNAQAQNLGVIFNRHRQQISQVFQKYGMGHLPTTPEWALTGCEAHGTAFLTDLATATGDNFDGNQANSILQIFGSAAGFATDLAGNIISIKNNAKPGTAPSNAAPAPQYTPPAATPPATEPKKYFGFTGMQLGVMGALLVAIVATVFLTRKK
jgi:hypothetical protein